MEPAVPAKTIAETIPEPVEEAPKLNLYSSN